MNNRCASPSRPARYNCPAKIGGTGSHAQPQITGAGRRDGSPEGVRECLPEPTRDAMPGVAPHYHNVVFAGGGNRCFWQAGFWSVAAGVLDLKPARVAAVSAGSAIACAIFSGGFEHGFRSFKQAIACNERNLYLRNLLGRQPVFPHGGMYRDAILSSISQPALFRLHQGPEILVLVSLPPRWASPGVAMVLAALATGIETWWRDGVHSTVGRSIGFEPAFIPVRECRTPESLADLIIASSCTPPLTPQARRNGVALLDGALVDNVPIEALTEESGKTLVLLTRRFKVLPSIPGRIYIQPSRQIPVSAYDYTDEVALQSAFDLGRRDAEAFCASIPS